MVKRKSRTAWSQKTKKQENLVKNSMHHLFQGLQTTKEILKHEKLNSQLWDSIPYVNLEGAIFDPCNVDKHTVTQLIQASLKHHIEKNIIEDKETGSAERSSIKSTTNLETKEDFSDEEKESDEKENSDDNTNSNRRTRKSRSKTRADTPKTLRLRTRNSIESKPIERQTSRIKRRTASLEIIEVSKRPRRTKDVEIIEISDTSRDREETEKKSYSLRANKTPERSRKAKVFQKTRSSTRKIKPKQFLDEIQSSPRKKLELEEVPEKSAKSSNRHEIKRARKKSPESPNKQLETSPQRRSSSPEIEESSEKEETSTDSKPKQVESHSIRKLSSDSDEIISNVKVTPSRNRSSEKNHEKSPRRIRILDEISDDEEPQNEKTDEQTQQEVNETSKESQKASIDKQDDESSDLSEIENSKVKPKGAKRSRILENSDSEESSGNEKLVQPTPKRSRLSLKKSVTNEKQQPESDDEIQSRENLSGHDEQLAEDTDVEKERNEASHDPLEKDNEDGEDLQKAVDEEDLQKDDDEEDLQRDVDEEKSDSDTPKEEELVLQLVASDDVVDINDEDLGKQSPAISEDLNLKILQVEDSSSKQHTVSTQELLEILSGDDEVVEQPGGEGAADEEEERTAKRIKLTETPSHEYKEQIEASRKLEAETRMMLEALPGFCGLLDNFNNKQELEADPVVDKIVEKAIDDDEDVENVEEGEPDDDIDNAEDVESDTAVNEDDPEESTAEEKAALDESSSVDKEKNQKRRSMAFKIRFDKKFTYSNFNCDSCKMVFKKNVDLQLHCLHHIESRAVSVRLYRAVLPKQFNTAGQDMEKYLRPRRRRPAEETDIDAVKSLVRKYCADESYVEPFETFIEGDMSLTQESADASQLSTNGSLESLPMDTDGASSVRIISDIVVSPKKSTKSAKGHVESDNEEEMEENAEQEKNDDPDLGDDQKEGDEVKEIEDVEDADVVEEIPDVEEEVEGEEAIDEVANEETVEEVEEVEGEEVERNENDEEAQEVEDVEDTEEVQKVDEDDETDGKVVVLNLVDSQGESDGEEQICLQINGSHDDDENADQAVEVISESEYESADDVIIEATPEDLPLTTSELGTSNDATTSKKQESETAGKHATEILDSDKENLDANDVSPTKSQDEEGDNTVAGEVACAKTGKSQTQEKSSPAKRKRSDDESKIESKRAKVTNASKTSKGDSDDDHSTEQLTDDVDDVSGEVIDLNLPEVELPSSPSKLSETSENDSQEYMNKLTKLDEELQSIVAKKGKSPKKKAQLDLDTTLTVDESNEAN